MLKIIQFLIFLKLLILSLFSLSTHSASLPLVKVASVEQWQNGIVNKLNCKVDVPYLTAFSSENNARLNFILPAGTHVKKGDLIAEQDSFYLKQALLNAEQKLNMSKLEVEYHANELSRFNALKQTLVSPSTLNSFSFKHQQALSKNVLISNEITEIKHRIEKLKYVAPSNGVIAEISTQPGKYLHQGGKLLSFLSDKDKEINCELPIADFYNKLNQNLNHFYLDKTSLKVKRIKQIINTQSQFINLHLKPEQAHIPFLLGQRVQVNMRSEYDKLTRLPIDGINLSGSKNFAWRVANNGEIEKLEIKIISNQSDYFIIESDLIPGDKVIILGKSGLKDKQKVKFNLVADNTHGERL